MIAYGDQAHQQHLLAALIEDIPVAPFGSAAARAYGPAGVASASRKRDQLDKLIAAHAISLDLILVTNNVRDFACYGDVKLENWLEN